jgi:oligopeptide/dipeptide ABC transporter ATP-binding protein
MRTDLYMEPARPEDSRAVLEVTDLSTHLKVRSGIVRAVDRVSFSLAAGETLGLVGESGCGKTMTALSILRLVPEPGKIVGGSVRFQGKNLLDIAESEMRKVRGKNISMIFQEPMSSLNPVVTIGRQISEAIVLHEGLSRRDARDKTVEMLTLVHIPEARRCIDYYPHQISGGTRQRVMIAMALCCNPKILLADEPTTALDVTIQAQILNLLRELQAKFGTAVVLITHDLGIIAQNADRIVVMYAGKIVEVANVDELFMRSLHPYTKGLLASVPQLDGRPTDDALTRPRLTELAGSVPSLLDLPSGCAFEPRCPYASSVCRTTTPALEEKHPGHSAACWHSEHLAKETA